MAAGETSVAKSEASKSNPASRRAELDLVKAAIAKKQAGNEAAITAKERRAWERWEDEEDERRGRRFLAAMPKKLYSEFAGRQTKVLHEQADAYGIPLRGATINVGDVLRWLHDFLAEHKYELPAIVRGEGGGTPREQLIREQVEVYRRRVTLLEMKIETERTHLLPRSEVHELLAGLSKVLRGAGERLQKQFGDQAASILDVALDDYDATLTQLLPKSDSAATDSGHAAPVDD